MPKGRWFPNSHRHNIEGNSLYSAGRAVGCLHLTNLAMEKLLFRHMLWMVFLSKMGFSSQPSSPEGQLLNKIHLDWSRWSTNSWQKMETLGFSPTTKEGAIKQNGEFNTQRQRCHPVYQLIAPASSIHPRLLLLTVSTCAATQRLGFNGWKLLSSVSVGQWVPRWYPKSWDRLKQSTIAESYLESPHYHLRRGRNIQQDIQT